MSETFVIVGGGLAGAKTAEALRDKGFDGRIVLIGDESLLPYERPGLSKGYLLGNDDADSLRVHDQQWYDDQRVDLRLGQAATFLDLGAHRVTLADGSGVDYAKLLLATGARPRTLDVPGSDADGVMYLRALDQSTGLRSTLDAIDRLVIIGSGWIGLEVAAAARAADVAVDIVETASLPLLRALGREVAQNFAALHREHGVRFHFDTSLDRITVGADGRVSGVRLVDGTDIGADTVLIGVGAAPNVELAQAAGLDVDNGVLVDASLRTSDPDVYAVGDIANYDSPALGYRIRVEHWANALNQPAVAAEGMLGHAVTFTELPFFFSDQYDLGMEYRGDSTDYDNVVFRGDVAKNEYLAFWRKDGRVIAAMNVNVWDVGDPLEALIRSGRSVDADRLADPAVDLTDL